MERVIDVGVVNSDPSIPRLHPFALPRGGVDCLGSRYLPQGGLHLLPKPGVHAAGNQIIYCSTAVDTTACI